MNLHQALSIPYVRGAETVYDHGQQCWVRRFEYPELGCVVETDATLDGLRELEVARVARIVELMAEGRPVPRPRAPLTSTDPVLLLERLGMAVAPELLALDESGAPHSAAFRTFADEMSDRAGTSTAAAVGPPVPI